MKTLKTLNGGLRLSLLALLLAACSLTLSEATPLPATQAPSVATVATAASAPAAPTALPWAERNLTGALIYTQGKLGILKLNLVTGAVTALLARDDKMWLREAAISPDSETLVITYSPPPTGDQVQLGYTGLYQIATDGSTVNPEPVLPQVDPQESYFTPTWTPDGKYLYYAHFVPVRDSSGNTFKYTIERIKYPNNQPEVVIADAIAPTISPDGTQLAYLKFNAEKYTQELYISDLAGQNARPVIPPLEFPSVDAQFFSPDGKTLVFNAVGEGQSPALSFWDQLLGVQVAAAHSVPSDWWSIQLGVADAKPVRLTTLYDTGMSGDFSPDGQHIAFLAASGMYVMDPTGENVQPLIPIKSLGTLEWVR